MATSTNGKHAHGDNRKIYIMTTKIDYSKIDPNKLASYKTHQALGIRFSGKNYKAIEQGEKVDWTAANVSKALIYSIHDKVTNPLTHGEAQKMFLMDQLPPKYVKNYDASKRAKKAPKAKKTTKKDIAEDEKAPFDPIAAFASMSPKDAKAMLKMLTAAAKKA